MEAFLKFSMLDDGGIDTSSVQTRTVGGHIDAHFSGPISLNTRVHLKGPWFVLGKSYPDVSRMKQIKHLLATIPPILVHFRLLNVSKIG